jgi:2-methylaconitate cis-trans-isomerase PrpF
MGLGDVASKVVPKPALVAGARHGGNFAARYFMPWKCHPALATTGAVTLATCATQPGTIVHALSPAPETPRTRCSIEHPQGRMEVAVERGPGGALRCQVLRTARKLFDGTIHIPLAAFSPGETQ